MADHDYYIKAAAEALEAADIAVVDWNADLNDPRDGWIELGRDVTAAQYGAGNEVSLLWTEERGWSIGWGREGTSRLDWIHHLGTGVLPTPDDMVGVAKAAIKECPGHLDNGSVYRSFEDQDDGFEERLAAYAPKDPTGGDHG